MNGAEYRKAIKALDLTQVGAARMLGVNDRTSRRWIADDVPIPQSVAIVLLMMIKNKNTADDIARLLKGKKKREASATDRQLP